MLICNGSALGGVSYNNDFSCGESFRPLVMKSETRFFQPFFLSSLLLIRNGAHVHGLIMHNGWFLHFYPKIGY